MNYSAKNKKHSGQSAFAIAQKKAVRDQDERQQKRLENFYFTVSDSWADLPPGLQEKLKPLADEISSYALRMHGILYANPEEFAKLLIRIYETSPLNVRERDIRGHLQTAFEGWRRDPAFKDSEYLKKFMGTLDRLRPAVASIVTETADTWASTEQQEPEPNHETQF